MFLKNIIFLASLFISLEAKGVKKFKIGKFSSQVKKIY